MDAKRLDRIFPPFRGSSELDGSLGSRVFPRNCVIISVYAPIDRRTTPVKLKKYTLTPNLTGGVFKSCAMPTINAMKPVSPIPVLSAAIAELPKFDAKAKNETIDKLPLAPAINDPTKKHHDVEPAVIW
jgi:hypothetical protein